jgi:hypothetical protein
MTAYPSSTGFMSNLSGGGRSASAGYRKNARL